MKEREMDREKRKMLSWVGSHFKNCCGRSSFCCLFLLLPAEVFSSSCNFFNFTSEPLERKKEEKEKKKVEKKRLNLSS